MSTFRFPVRVYYDDTDAGGMVYHANYLKMAERARTEWLRGLGLSQQAMLADGKGFAFVVRRIEIDFVKSARLDDLLSVDTDLLEIGGASLDFRQAIRRDGIDMARLDVRVAFISLDGRPARIPSDLRVSFQGLVSERR